jgi:hypothetical protein
MWGVFPSVAQSSWTAVDDFVRTMRIKHPSNPKLQGLRCYQVFRVISCELRVLKRPARALYRIGEFKGMHQLCSWARVNSPEYTPDYLSSNKNVTRIRGFGHNSLRSCKDVAFAKAMLRIAPA